MEGATETALQIVVVTPVPVFMPVNVITPASLVAPVNGVTLAVKVTAWLTVDVAEDDTTEVVVVAVPTF